MRFADKQATWFIALIVAQVWIASAQLCGMVQGAPKLEPDRLIQDQLRTVASLIKDAGEPGGPEALLREILKLDPSGERSTDLVRQLLWHHAHSDDGVEQAMTLFAVIDIMDVSNGALVEAIAPLLGEVQDPRLERACIEVANIVETPDVMRGSNFWHYRSHLDGRWRRNENFEPGLIAHMFRRSPGQALQVLASIVYQDERSKPFLWARHVVDDLLWKRKYGFAAPKEQDPAVTRELEKMASRDEWWARLYAAEVMRQFPELSSKGAAERLARDPHALVRETAKKIGSS